MTQPLDHASLQSWTLHHLLDQQSDAMMAARNGDPQSIEIANAFRREIQRRLELLMRDDTRA